MDGKHVGGFGKSRRHAGALLLAAGVLLITASGSGCAPKKGFVTLEYMSAPRVTRIPGAEKMHLTVKVTDARSVQDRVSATKTLQGTEVAPIISRNDVTELVDEALRAELRNRGFHSDGGAVTLEIEIREFYNDFRTGFWYRQAKARSSFMVRIRDAEQNIRYAKRMGNEFTRPVFLSSAKQAKIALETVLRDTMEALFSDGTLYDALFAQ